MGPALQICDIFIEREFTVYLNALYSLISSVKNKNKGESFDLCSTLCVAPSRKKRDLFMLKGKMGALYSYGSSVNSLKPKQKSSPSHLSI